MQIIPKFAGTGQFDSVRASGATVSWGSTVNSAAGGQYRLCWCAAMGDCSDFRYFSVDLGELQVYGPTPLQQDQTCVSGRTCSFGASVHGAHTWSVSILDTCGQNPALLHGTAQVVGSSFASVSFTSLTASGGIYRLCWCSSRDCSTANSFVVDAGKLELVGVSGMQDRTCMSGRACEIDGIFGHHIFNEDFLQILETCGISSRLSLPRQQLSFTGGSARATWPSVPLAAYGGKYRICWCSGQGASAFEGNSSHDCSSSQDFIVEVGNLAILGPSFSEQMRTCVSGQSCKLTGLLGEGFLAESSEILVAETCGTASVISGFVRPSQTLQQNLLLEASWAAVTAAGGRYRLCWCSPTQGNRTDASGASECEVASNFRIDMGGLTVLGPQLGQDRTCISGRTCFVDGILGEGLLETDSVLVLETCGMNEVVPRFSGSGFFTNISRSGASISWGGTQNTAAGGNYRLCWCSADFPCNVAKDFQVDFGSLVLLGVSPLNQAATCVAGRACPSSWTFGVAGAGEAIALDTCGAERAVAPARMNSNITGLEVLEKGAVGSWRLCWCLGGCQTLLQYAVDVGELTILGPLPSNRHTCVSGLPCLADGLLGLDFSASDAFVVLVTCGTAATPGRFPNSAFAVFDILTGTLRWDGNSSRTAVTAAGGEYRLCWCRPLSDVDCMAPADFRYEAGIVTVVGPSPFQQDKTCISGAACALGSFMGNLLSPEDGLMVMKDCGSNEGIVAGIPALTLGNSSFILSAGGGSYRICWCTPPSRAFATGLPSFSWETLGGCYLQEDFVVDVGALTVLGPYRDHVRTCVAGAICSSALQGLGITSVDYNLQILDTCSGLAAEIGKIETRNSSAALWFDEIKAAGGSYRLCWCGLDACHEKVDVGAVFLLGVAPLQQHRTCVAGQICRLDGIESYGNLDASHLMILQTCNVPRGVGISDVRAATESGVALGNFSNASQETMGAQSKAWILDGVTLFGGGYRMCWCGSIGALNSTQNQTVDCRRVTGSQVDFGELLVMGPSSIVDLTCVSGQACSVDGLLGQHLSSSDSLTILDTCGSFPSDRFQGIPQHGLAVTVAASGSAANWGFSIPLTGPGGFYRLCWCAAGFSCASSKDFSVEIGSLSLRGPSPLAQDRTCVAGYTCNVALDGFDMNPHVVEAVTAFRLALDPSNAVSAGLSSLDVYYTSLQTFNVSEADLAGSCSMLSTASFVSAGDGLLWYACSWMPAVTASRWLVSLQSDASLHLYEAEFLGRNGWTAIALNAGASGIIGNAASLSDGILSSWALASSGSQLGFDALQPDTVLLADTCAVDFLSFPSNLVWGPVSLSPYQADVLTAQGGRYRLCWCARGCGCSFMQDFSVDAGQLTVVGPKKVFNTCIAGTSCTIELDGQHLSDASQVLVLHTCAVENARVWKLTDLGAWQHLSGAATFASTGVVTSAAGTYKLCWCSGLSACSTASDFSVEAGDLLVMGVAPLVQAHTCVSGQSCVVDHLSGLGLSKDQIMVLETCGTNSLLYRGLDASEVVNGSSATLTWKDDLTAPGGQYRLCWCSASNGCLLAEHFQVDFGRFTIIGPSPLLQTWTCISGQTCRLDGGITGLGTSVSSGFVVMDTCGAADGEILLYDPLLASVTHSGEHSVLSLPGASYRMCWCATSTYPCSMAESFKVDFGRLLVVGPYPLMQDRTCVAGSICEVDGFTGVGLSISDLLVIQDTCANRHSRIGFPTAGTLMPLTLSAGSAYVSAEGSDNSTVFNVLSASGGQYRLCWTSWMALQLETLHAGNSSDNDAPFWDFQGGCNDTLGGNRTCAYPQAPGRMTMSANVMVDIGRLTLIGPSPLDHVRTCVSGQLCSFGSQGVHLDVLDQIAILDTCGQPGRVTQAARRTFASWIDFGILTLPGGTYRLCWCSQIADCGIAESYPVDFGSLSMIGPAQSEQFTCVSGRMCTISGLMGTSFSNYDRLMILDTCGVSAQGGASTLVPHIPDDGMGMFASSGHRVVWDGRLTAFGGLYRLCWCAGSPTGAFDNPMAATSPPSWSGAGAGGFAVNATGNQSVSRRLSDLEGLELNSSNISINHTDPGFLCQQVSHFRVDVGELLLIGPQPIPAATCVSGQTCVIEVVTQASDSFMLMDTCAISASSLGGLAARPAPVVSWGSSALVGAGGTYRLCWCWNDAAAENASNATDFSAAGLSRMQMENASNSSSGSRQFCQQTHDFAVDVGPLLLLGPSPLSQDRTCVSGYTCTIEGIVGTELEDLLIQDTCGSASLVSAANFSSAQRWELPLLTQQGGMYRLCWCSSMFSCQGLDDFRVDFGILHLLGPGPLSQDRTCVSGCPCTIDRLNVYPPELMGMSLVVLSSCASMQLVNGFPTDAAEIDISTRAATWSQVTAAGGVYRLCWHAESAPGVFNQTENSSVPQFANENRSMKSFLPSDHTVLMGELLLIGPAKDHDVTCISGGRCAAKLRGFHLADTDFMAILDTCGVSAASQLASVQQLKIAGAEAVFVDWPGSSMNLDGGQYRMCWCYGSNTSRCDSAQFFQVDVGSLSIRGPRPILRTCIVGRACAVTDIDGFALSHLDQLLLLETCGGPMVAEGSVSQVLGTEMSAIFTIARAGTYRLCWCGAEPRNLNATACTSPFEFLVDAGQMSVLGPNPSQHRTCVSGQRCSLDGLLGTGLSNDDVVLVMDTCGSPSVVPLFPRAGLSFEVGRDGAYASWGNDVVTSMGGAYRLCWCTQRRLNTSISNGINASEPDCTLPEAFGVDFGALLLRGPAELAQPLLCIVGQECIMPPVSGTYISASDWFRVLDTCGVDVQQPLLQADTSLQVLSVRYPTPNSSDEFNTSAGWNRSLLALTNASRLQAIPAAGIPATGGQYRLCWCGFESNCLPASSYRVDFGSLALAGPNLMQSRTCISGQSCVINSILGYGPSNATSFLVMHTCGMLGSVLGAFSNPVVSSSGAAVQWSAEPMQGGSYRLCWCGTRETTNNATRGCDLSWSLKVDFGSLIVRGPSPLWQAFTCVAGQVCRVDGITGQDLSVADEYLMLDTCSSDRQSTDVLDAQLVFSRQPYRSSLESEGVVLVHGGQYRLCWCGASGAENSSDSLLCDLPSDYLVDFAGVSIIGPSSFDQDKTCVAGRSCAVRSVAGHLTSGSDMLMIAATCGQNDGVIHGLADSGLMLSSQANSTLSRWLLTSVSAQGAQYRLCWCAAGHVCSTMEHFRVDVGAFTILGPARTEQAFTCMAGRECELDAITGLNLNINQLIILDTCGFERGPVGIPNAGRSTFSAESRASWGPLPITAAGGQYRLCWCADLNMGQKQNASEGCLGLADFAYDLGSLSIVGPAPLSQSHTCVSGRRCQLDGITGLGLSDSDKLSVLETCGQPSGVLPGWGLAGSSLEALSSGASASWQAVVSAAGGQYRLCWCTSPPLNATRAGHPSCDQAGAFVVDMGAMLLLGPMPLTQDQTCISGQTCASSGLVAAAGGASLPGRVHVLDTCGQAGFLERFPAGGLARADVRLLEGIAYDSSYAGEVLDLNGMSLVNWNSEALTVSAGQYRLCWCTLLPSPTNASSCSLASEFGIDFGTLHVYGPLTDHHRTCVSGYTCALDGIAGYGMSRNDSILVLETCGSRQVVPHFPWGGLVEEVSASGSQINWGDTVISAHGGSYRLCWCSQAGSCKWPEAFLFDLGELVLLGPGHVDRTCVAGQSCHLDGLLAPSDMNSYMILETCGVAEAPLNVLAASATISEPSGQVSWGTSPLLLPAGVYQLCWCGLVPPGNSSMHHANHTNDGNLSNTCQLSLHHRVTAGTLIMIGAAAEQQRTCVSGLTCIIDSIEGYHLSLDDQVLVMDTCASEIAPGFAWSAQASNMSRGRLSFSWGSLRTTPVGGFYRLCWCGASMACNQASEFRVDFGQLQILGPTPHRQHQTCVSGNLCDLSSGLLMDANHSITGSTGLRYAILALDTCGGVAVPSGFPVMVHRNSSWNSTGAQQNNFLSAAVQVLVTAPGGFYRLCWCGIPDAATGCRLPEDFRVDLGTLSLIGPRQSSHTCISGQACSLEDLQGLHLSKSNVYMVLDTCGASARNWPEGYAGPVIPPTIPENTAILGGQYQLCWCAGLWGLAVNDTSNLNSSFPCQRAEDFAAWSGTFTILGPAPLSQHRTCVSGQTCVLDGLAGLGLSDFDMLTVQDTCGVPSALSRFPEAAHLQVLDGLNARASWESTRLSSSGGAYRLCWARLLAGNSSNSSATAASFNVDVGELLVVGPSPLQQTATCVSGQRCRFDALSGHGLDGGGHLLLAETCGLLLSDRFRFPSDGLLSWEANQSTVDWSLTRNTAAGQSYRLCWCALGFTCSSSEHFRVDAGSLNVIGPAPLSQGRTCISGSSCSFALDLEPMSHNTSDQGKILIMSTCGTAAGDLALPTEFLGPLGSASWSSVLLPGGQYRLCWCAVLQSGDCAISEQFAVDLGSFLLLGPMPNQKFTCLSGQTCKLPSLFVTGGADSDQMLIAETCGAARSSRRQSLTRIPQIFKTAPDVLSASWGGAALVQAGGSYQLCWCGRFCGTSEAFASPAGTLYIQGPAPLQQQFTCISGQSCSLRSLSGQGISSGALLVMETCGSPPTALQFAPGEPADLVSAEVYLSGGSYRLCWCALAESSNASYCDLSSPFLVDVGMLSLVGPAPLQQQYTCISGQTCTMRGIQGILHRGDVVAVLDTCGSRDAWPFNLFNALDLQSDGSWALSWGHDALSTPGGQYRLCWCAEGARCQDASALRLDFGSLTLLGPDNLLLDRTCVSGRTCSFDGLISSSGVLILDTCGLPSVGKRWNAASVRMPHFMSQLEHMEIENGKVNWGDLQFSAAGGVFRLCWCAENATCLVPEHFRLDIGQLLLMGPSFGHSQSCISGMTCSISGVKGWQLSETDRVMVLDTCAQPGNASRAPLAVAGFPSDGISLSAVRELNLTEELVRSQGPLMRFELDGYISAQGGSYRLCWCGGHAACSSSEDFLVDFGELHLFGPAPLQQSQTCISGHHCFLNKLAGYHLADGQLALFDTCGVHGAGLDGVGLSSLCTDGNDCIMPKPAF